MKALSIRQPWPWAILHAGKRIENRDWRSCHYRGLLLLHASKGCTRDEYEDARAWMINAGLTAAWEGCGAPVIPSLEELHRGGIVGVCNLVGVVNHEGQASAGAPKFDARWFFGPLGLVLDNVRPLPFVAFKGALGFFDVPGATPEDVVEVARREGRLRADGAR